jgi:hypothetical protein
LFTGVWDAPALAALAEAFSDPVKLNQAIHEINRYSTRHQVSSVRLREEHCRRLDSVARASVRAGAAVAGGP